MSIAYDIVRGNIRAVYSSKSFFNLVAPVCCVGDTIGCGVQFGDEKSEKACVFFTKNGSVVQRVELLDLLEDLYPIIGFVPSEKQSTIFMDWNTPVFEPQNIL